MTSAWDLHRAFPEADFVVVPDAGHSVSEKVHRHWLMRWTGSSQIIMEYWAEKRLLLFCHERIRKYGQKKVEKNGGGKIDEDFKPRASDYLNPKRLTRSQELVKATREAMEALKEEIANMAPRTFRCLIHPCLLTMRIR